MILASFIERFIPPDPMEWPRWTRRVFLLTLPVSGPVLVSWWLAFLVALAVIGLGCLLWAAVRWVLSQLLGGFVWMARAVEALWNGPSGERQ